jgi:hypothetical protein
MPQDGAPVRRIVQPRLEFSYAGSTVAGLDLENLGGDRGLADRGAVGVGRWGSIEGLGGRCLGVGACHAANATESRAAREGLEVRYLDRLICRRQDR